MMVFVVGGYGGGDGHGDGHGHGLCFYGAMLLTIPSVVKSLKNLF